MFMKSVRRVLGGVMLATLALTGCGDTEQAQLSEEAVEQSGTAQVEQGVSVISGYDISIRSTGPYTLTGSVMPRWTAPSGHSAYDWLALARVGSSAAEYISWVYVGSTDVYGLLPVQLPNSLDTTQQYEIRYFTNGNVLAAKTAAFTVKALPVLSGCPGSEGGGELSEVHAVPLGKTSGTVTFNYSGHGGEIPDRFLVYQGTTLLFDSGCVDGSHSATIAYNNAAGRLRVAVQPSCTYFSSGTGWSWNMSCGQ